MPVSEGCQDIGVMAELVKNVRAREKCLWPWKGRSRTWSLEPQGLSQEGAGGELEAGTWTRRVEAH